MLLLLVVQADAEVGDADEATAVEQFMTVVDEAAKASQAQAPKYAKKAWVFLDRDVFPRKQCIWIVEQSWFDTFILLLIGANCLTMVVRAAASRHRRPAHAAARSPLSNAAFVRSLTLPAPFRVRSR